MRCKGTASLSRGGESSITYHYEIDRDGDAFIGYKIGDPISTPTPATTPSPGSTLDTPISDGEALKGSDGTEILVLGVADNAEQQVAEQNRFNDPPEEGHRFYMLSVEVSYPFGSGSVTVSSSDFSLIGENRVVYDPFDNDCGIIPNELNGEVFAGGKIQGNVCFEILEDEAGLILIHEPGFEAEARRFLVLPIGGSTDPTPTPSATATAIPTPLPTATPTPESTPAVTPAPSALPAPSPTPVPIPAPTATPVPTPTAMPDPTPAVIPSPSPTSIPGSFHTVSGQGTDVNFVDLPAGQWVVIIDLSGNDDLDLTQIKVGGEYVASVFQGTWNGRSLISVGEDSYDIPPGRAPIEVETAEGTSWTLNFVNPPPPSNLSQPITGHGQDVKFVDFPDGEWVVEVEVSGGQSGFFETVNINIGGKNVVNESGVTWGGREFIIVGNSYGEISPGSTAIEVGAQKDATWTLTFTRASELPVANFDEDIAGQGTDVMFVDLPAGQWVVVTDLSDSNGRDLVEIRLTQIKVGGNYVASVFQGNWNGRSLITVGNESSDIPPGRNPIEVEAAQDASWTVNFTGPPPASDPTEPISGQGQDVNFVELNEGEWLVEIEVSGNEDGFTDNFVVNIGGKGIVNENERSWSGKKLVVVGNAYDEIPPGNVAIEVEAGLNASWTITFTRP